MFVMISAAGQQRTAKITGVVSDQNGAAIANATVEFDANGTTTRTTTDETGNFTVLSTRTYGTLSISSPGFSSVQIKLTSIDDPLRIQLYPAGVMERIVVNAPVDYDHTPVSQFNLGPREINSSGALTIDDVLRQVPGFSLFRRSGGLTTNPTAQGISLRGVGASGASRAVVLFDGVPLNSPFGGWVYWNRIPRTSIENVFVQNGGNSNLYGSAALGGVVNISGRTKDMSGLNFEASAGNEGTAVTSFTGGKTFGDWGFVASGQALHTDG